MNLKSWKTYGERYRRWRFCGEEHDYGLLRREKPRDVAERLIHQVFSEDEISTKIFTYKTHYYTGINNLQDWVEVYYIDLYI